MDFLNSKNKLQAIGARNFFKARRIILTLSLVFLFEFIPLAGFVVVEAASNINSVNSASANSIVEVSKKDFSTDESPVISLEVEKRPIINIFNIGKTTRQISSIDLIAPDGSTRPLRYDVTGEKVGRSTLDIVNVRTDNFSQPGQYTVAVAIVEDGQSQMIKQEFSWGVLVMNPDKAIYRPNETATVDLGMVDDEGKTVCSADMVLTVTDPAGGTLKFSTANNTITASAECGPNSVTKIPDYRATVQLGGAGDYQVALEASTPEGTHSLQSTLVVAENIPFDIKRTGPSRIWPLAEYPMALSITPAEDYRGTVEEKLPADFVTKDISASGEEVATADTKIVRWNVDWQAGTTYELFYSFDAPDVSPALFTLGPVTIGDYREQRQWQIASDVVANNGRLYYGDGTNTAMRFQTHTNPFTFNGELSFTHGASASLMAHTVAKTAPTRDEVMVGSLKVDGQLMVIKGINGYDVNTDYSLAWTNTGTTGTQTCAGTSEVDCTRAFDIAYEKLSGRAMVVYADTTAQKLYYCYNDGTNWGPVSNCAPTNGTNDITLSSNGRPNFVSLSAQGGSNKILLGTSIDVAGTMEVEAFVWDGSAWGTSTVATSTTNASTGGLEHGQIFDVAWESLSGDAMVLFADAAGSGATVYRTLPSGGSWGSDQAGPTSVGSNGDIQTLRMASDPVSNRIGYVYTDSLNDSAPGVWKADGSTAGWTLGNEDAGLEATEPGVYLAELEWENFGSQAVWVAQTGGTTVDTEYQTISCDGTGCTFGSIDATMPTAGADDGNFVRMIGSPNSSELMVLWGDHDRVLTAQHWTGSAWESSATTSIETALAPGTGANTNFHGMSAHFAYIPYSPWSRNWKFWQGTDTTNTPTNQLAGENTTPTGLDPDTGKFRLRFSVAELSGMGQTDARKKLQYATADPDAASTTWTDVDDPAGAGIWRYVDCNSGDAAICNDNAALAGTTLSGSPTAGWWNLLATGGTVTNMDQTALQLRELEFSVEANAATASTTFYFRMYDIDQNSPVLREQDNDGSNDCATAACTYPSITTGAASISIGGTCLAYDQSTPCGDLGDIAVAVGGSLQAQVDTGGGTGGSFNITGVSKPSNNAIVTVFVNGSPAAAANRAVAITKYDGAGAITGLILYKEHLTIGSGDTPATLSSAELGSYDNSVASGDDDVFFDYRTDWTTNSMTATGGAITGFQIDCDSPATTCNTFSTQEELYIQTGWTYQPGTAVATHDVENLGTLTVGTNALTISGSYLNSSTFTKSATQTTTFTSGSTGETITAGSSSFANLTFNGSGDWATQTNAVTVDEVLTITAGTLKMGAVAHTVTGTTSITGTLELTSNTGAKLFVGGVTVNATGTWNNSAPAAVTFRGGLTNNSAEAHTWGTVTYTFETTAAQAIGGTNAISMSTVSVSSGVTLTNNGTLTITVALSGAGNFTNGATGVLNENFTGAITLAGTFSASTTGNTVNYGFAGTQTVAAVTYHHLTLSNSGAKTTTSVATVNGDFNMSGLATTTTNALATVGGNIILAGTSQLTLGTVALVTVTGDITVGTGTTLAANVSTTVNGGDITVTSTGAITSSAGTLTVAGGGATGITGNGNITLTNLATAGSGTVIYSASGTNIINTDVTVAASTTLDIRSTVAITGSVINTTTGIVDSTTGTPTVTVSGTTIGGGTGAITFYNLTKSGAGSTGWINASGGNTVKNDLTISAGTFVAPAGILNVGASFQNSAGFTHSSGTIALTTSAPATISGSTTFNNLSISGIGAPKTITFVHGTTQTVSGLWTVAGTLGNVITLQRDNTSAWTINPASASVDYATVSWSNSGLAICATHSTDGLNNNANWTFSSGASCGIDVAGTSNSSGGTVRVAVNSSEQAQTTTLAATWTISGVSVNSTDVVTVYVEGLDGVETTGVTQYDGTGNIGGMVLNTNVLSIGSDDNQTIDLTDLDLYSCADNENVMHSVAAGVLDVEGTDAGCGANPANSYTDETMTVTALDTLSLGNSQTMNAHNMTVNASGILTSGTLGVFNVSGTWDNNGTFTASTSTVTFNSGATETVEAGASSFNNVVFDNTAGSWTVQTDNMTTNDLTLNAGTSFTLANTKVMEVDGNYSQVIAAANTTWTGSTLYLNGSGGMYDINTKTHGGDTFATLRIGASEDIAMWDSSAATTYTIDAGGCLFSEDHAGSSGRLNIYGTCNSRANEYWSYASDFDGAGVTRQADVRFAPSATMTVDSGDTLAILGQSALANRSLVTRESAGNYGLTVSGTINAQYYDFDYLNASGLNITGTATVTELSNGSFDNNAAGAASNYITVAGISSTKNFFGNTFDSSTDGTDADVDYNVNADGANISWTFFNWDGNKGGDDYDTEANGADVMWNSDLSLTVSDTTMALGVVNPLAVNSDSHTISVTTNAVNGYTCRAVADGNLRNGSDDIDYVADSTVSAGVEEYGVSCTGADCQLSGDNPLSGSPLTVASRNSRASAIVTTLYYKAAVSSLTKGLGYSQIVTITCGGDF